MNLSFQYKALLLFIKNNDLNLHSRLEVYLKTLSLYPNLNFHDKLILMFHDNKYQYLHDRIKVLIECMAMN